MISFWLRGLRTSVLVLAASTLPAQAHLMVEQKGTLNVVGEGGFLVLSLPVSAFEGADDDGDGRLSAAEFDTHRTAVAAQVNQGLKLLDAKSERVLQGMRLSLVPSHDASSEPSEQLVVMGRFPLTDIAGKVRLRIDLFGVQPIEQHFEITAKRKIDGQKLSFELSPKSPEGELAFLSQKD